MKRSKKFYLYNRLYYNNLTLHERTLLRSSFKLKKLNLSKNSRLPSQVQNRGSFFFLYRNVDIGHPKVSVLMEMWYSSLLLQCAFAHLDVEMRQKAIIHSRYKTKACNNFAKTGSCKYGDRCLFLHAETKIKI